MNWFDSKVNQSQAFSNPFQNTLSVKQPVESKFQQVDFSLSFENVSFSKELKSNNLINLRGLTNSNYTRDTHNHQQGLQEIHLDLETSKHLIQHLFLHKSPFNVL